jgi:hypothetical protein
LTRLQSENTYFAVKRLKVIVAVMLLAIFSLASSHALLESFELIHHDESHSHAESPASPNSHDVADGICRVDSHRAQVQKSFADVQTELSKIFTLVSYSLQQNSEQAAAKVEICSPPLELKTSWQFSARTALPSRAPSIAS